MFGRDRSADGRGDYVRKDRSADGAERVAARVAGGGEEACVAHAAGLGGLLDEGTRSSGGSLFMIILRYGGGSDCSVGNLGTTCCSQFDSNA